MRFKDIQPLSKASGGGTSTAQDTTQAPSIGDASFPLHIARMLIRHDIKFDAGADRTVVHLEILANDPAKLSAWRSWFSTSPLHKRRIVESLSENNRL
jgi:hypothetical protein